MSNALDNTKGAKINMSNLFLNVLELSIISSILILLVIAIRGIFSGKMPKWIVCILWAIVGIKLLIPISFESEFGIIPKISLESEKETSELSAETNLGESFETSLDESFETNLDESFETSLDESFETSLAPIPNESLDNTSRDLISSDGEDSKDALVGGITSIPPNTDQNNAESFPDENGEDEPTNKTPFLSLSTIKIFSVLWLSGALIMIFFGVTKYIKLKRRVAVFSLHKDGTRKCEAIDSPFVLGIFSPHIYLPFNLSEETEKYIIAHEKAHVKRFDHISKLVAYIALAVHWFNPLVWVAFILLCKDIEYACDEKVLNTLSGEEKKYYASALLECSIKSSKISACPVAFGEIGVKERVKNILSYKKPLLWIIIASIVLCIILSVVFFTTEKNDNEQSGETSDIQSNVSENAESSKEENSSEEGSENEANSKSEVKDLFFQYYPQYKDHLAGNLFEKAFESENGIGIILSGTEDTEYYTHLSTSKYYVSTKGLYHIEEWHVDVTVSEVFLLTSGKLYELDNVKKTYQEVSPSTFGGQNSDYITCFEEEIDGKSYIGELYRTVFDLGGGQQITLDTKFYFHSDDKTKLAFVKDGETLYTAEYTEDIPEGIFEIPSDYTQYVSPTIDNYIHPETNYEGVAVVDILKKYNKDDGFGIHIKDRNSGKANSISTAHETLLYAKGDKIYYGNKTYLFDGKNSSILEDEIYIENAGKYYTLNVSEKIYTEISYPYEISVSGLFYGYYYVSTGTRTETIDGITYTIDTFISEQFNSKREFYTTDGTLKFYKDNGSIYDVVLYSKDQIPEGIFEIPSDYVDVNAPLDEPQNSSSEDTNNDSSSEDTNNNSSSEDTNNNSSSEDTNNDSSSEDTDNNSSSEDEEPIPPGPTPQSIDLYVRNGDSTGFNVVKSTTTGSIGDIISQLIAKNTIPKGTKVYSFSINGKTAKIDLSEEFGKALETGALEEELTTGSLINTIIKFYGVDKVSFTVEGEILETGYVRYDFPMGFITPTIDTQAEIKVSGTCGDNAKWKIMSDATLIIYGSGAMYDDYQPWADTNYYIESLIISNGITSIGNEAFANYGCKYLSIGNTVSSIGHGAFRGWKSLKTVVIPSSVKTISWSAFFSCPSLSSLTINSGVQEIESSAFGYCTELKNVTLPDTVKVLGQQAFVNCTKLTSVKIGNGVKVIEISAFDGCTALKTVDLGKIEKLESRAFKNCTSLESITLPDTITYMGSDVFAGTPLYQNSENWKDGALYIGNYLIATNSAEAPLNFVVKEGTKAIAGNAFYGNKRLRSISFPQSLKSIGNFAFYNCVLLSEISLPTTTYKIGNGAFENCTSLTSATLGNVTDMGESGDGAFEGCKNLKSVKFSAGTTAIGSRAFCGCSALSSVDLGGSVKHIPDEAFYGCSSLETFLNFKSVVSIGKKSFYGCTKIKQLDFENSLVSIGESAFASCTSLEKFILGSQAETISRKAFQDCTSLKSISLGNNVSYIGYDAFLNSGYYNSSENWENDILYIGQYLICGNPDTIFTDVVIKEGTFLIANSAFYNVSIKGNVIFPSTLKIIGSSAFCGSSLKSVVVPKSVESMGQSVFLQSKVETAVIEAPMTILPNSTFSLCHKLKEVTLPSTITTIEGSAFYFCENLETVNIPAKVKSIGNSAFENCKLLTNISIPSALEALGESAFEGCELLESITLPNSLQYIPKRAFYDCISLTSLTLGNNVSQIENEAFTNCKKLTSVELPKSLKSIGEHSIGFYAGFSEFYVVTGFTITAPKGSVAEKYATANKITFIAK